MIGYALKTRVVDEKETVMRDLLQAVQPYLLKSTQICQHIPALDPSQVFA